VIIKTFGEYCERLLSITETDRPYLIRMRCFNAEGVVFFRQPRFSPTIITGGYPKDVIDWPDYVRQTAEPFSTVTSHLCELLCNAFGLHW